MDEMAKGMRELHELVQKDHGADVAEAAAELDRVAEAAATQRSAVNRLRAGAALIANDAILYMAGEMRDRALAMAKATAAFCDFIEEESDLEERS